MKTNVRSCLFLCCLFLSIFQAGNAQSSYFFYSFGDSPWTFERRDMDGSNKTIVYTPSSDQVYESAVDGSINKVYFYDKSPAQVYKSDYDGSNRTSVFAPSTGLTSLAAGNGYLYYAYGSNPFSVRRINSDGSGDIEIYRNLNYGIVQKIAFDATSKYLYFYEYQYDAGGNNRIVRVHEDGTDLTVVFNNIEAITSLTAGGGYVFYSSSETPWSLNRYNFDGSGVTPIFTPSNPDEVRGCAYDGINNKIYYYDSSSTRQIYRADVDGSNPLTVNSGFTQSLLSLSAPSAAPALPEIAIRGNSDEISNGDSSPSLTDHTDFGYAVVTGSTVVRTFTIENTGSAALSLTGSPYVTLTGSHMADFSVSAAPSNNIASSGSTTFQITFDPSASGVRTASVSVANNDSDENPYNFIIQGTGSLIPAVTTQAVTTIGSLTATGNGNITDLGVPNPSQYGVCWSTDETPTVSDAKTEEGPASSTGPYTSNMSSLSPNTNYFVRAYALNSAGITYGAQVSFTTLPLSGTIATQAVTNITATAATGNGNITDLGAPKPTQHGVCWNTSGTPTVGDNKTEEGAASLTGAFTSNITSLSPYTTYYVRSYVTNTAGTTYGAQVPFTTSAVAATVSTQAVSGITATAATGNGNISDLGVPNPIAHGVCWNTTGTPTTSDSHSDEGVTSSPGPFSSNITSLSAITTYYVRAYTTNAAGTSYGSQVTFTTSPVAGTITSQAVSSVTDTTATGHGNITGLGAPNPTQHGVCWNTSGTPTVSDNKTEEGAVSSTGAFTSSLTALTPHTTYYVRAYVTNTAGTTYGTQVFFTTSAVAATVTTQAVSGITATTATGNGNITDLGAPNPTAHGVCWNTGGTPTIADNCTDEKEASATGPFISNISSLMPASTYYVRAYATNAAGTLYGEEVFFMTPNTYTLLITMDGEGSGKVMSTPSGINCGIDCEEDFGEATQVQLIATPSPSSKFIGWGGSSDCADGIVTMSTSVNCIATFQIGFPWLILQPALNHNGKKNGNW